MKSFEVDALLMKDANQRKEAANLNDQYYNHALEAIVERYKQACQWFDALGFSYTGNRYGAYMRALNEFQTLTTNKQPLPDSIVSFMRRFENAYMEAHELIRVHDALVEIESSSIMDQIKKIASGAEFRGGNDQSRDYLFELLVVARFIRAGYQVILSEGADVIADLDGNTRIFVECKRPKSKKKVRKNVSKANKQISRNVSRHHPRKAVGLVALNLSDFILANAQLQPDSPEAGTLFHRNRLANLISSLNGGLRSNASDKTLGLMVESSMMHYLSPRSAVKGFMCSRHSVWLPYSDSPLLAGLSAALSNQNVVRNA